VVVSAVGAVSVRYGSPPTIARHVYGDLGGPSNNVTNGDLNTRLTSLALGQRIPQWRVARDEYAAHPWLGSGLGSYSRYWTQHRPTPFKVLNVHNLYLETLAEQGPIGLGLLVVALGVPRVAAFRARRRALVPAAAGAYVAYLVHAAVDWDWQMPAVTLAALLCGVAMLLAARSAPSSASSLRRLQRVTALVLVALLGVLAFVGLRGNQAIAASRSAAARGDVAAAAAHARTARFWAPWSSQPWQLLAESQAATNHDAAARTSLERALAKDREDWNIWLDLAIASRGAERRRAFAEATKLNPLGPEIAAWKSATQGRG
jgi:hypothetical protein